MTPVQAEGRVMWRRFVLTLVIGISAGFSFGYVPLTSTGFTRDVAWSTPHSESLRNLSVQGQSSDEPAHRYENHSVADELVKKVRVLCWVMTQSSSHEKKARHVRATWGKRCNKLLFMSSEGDPVLPAIKLPVAEGRNYLWAKTKEAFRYVYEHHRRDADWFLKADDDTYVVVENLRYMLAQYDSKEPMYFGCRFKPFTSQGYMSGGAGYVLSRESLDRFVNQGLPSPHLCKASETGAADAEMGICLERIGVKAMDSRDALGRGRFFPFVPRDHLFPSRDKSFWYWKYIYYPTDEGLDCCSDHAVSFHYVEPQEMHVYDYLIYHLRPYGIRYGVDAKIIASKQRNQRESLRNLEKHPIMSVQSSDEPAHRKEEDEDRSVADELAKKVRVLCWVMTQPSNHEKKARHVKATWGKRCNKLLFMSSEEDPVLPAIKLPVAEGRSSLWAKTKEAFRYVYEHHRRDADWFLKADDDTYVVVENLRYMLLEYDSKEPMYFGCRFKPYTFQGYMSGGAGYVLSREALDRFVNQGLPSPLLCSASEMGAEDVEMGICLERIGVKAMDSRDALGRGRFFPFLPRDHLFPSQDKSYWYWKIIYYPTDEGLDCCSDHAVSFHYIKPQDMYVYDYLIYHLRPYGIRYGMDAKIIASKQTKGAHTLRTKRLKSSLRVNRLVT